VLHVSWSTVRGTRCMRLEGVPSGAAVRVMTAATRDAVGLPAMAGTLVADSGDICFVGRYGFVDGTTYLVEVDGTVAAVLERPRVERERTTEVESIRPTAREVPRNLLRFYVLFSAPMSEGFSAQHVRLVDDAGDPIEEALLSLEHELWDADRSRLTVLLDPARIKRGLVTHSSIGYPLRSAEPFTVVVDEAFLDARGVPLHGSARRRYGVGGDERRRVDPEQWTMTLPSAGTLDPLIVGFDRPLDAGLLARCLRVVRPGDGTVDGDMEIGVEERSWRLAPKQEWEPGRYELLVDGILEDVAGNSVRRVFERELGAPDTADVPAAHDARLTFTLA